MPGSAEDRQVLRHIPALDGMRGLAVLLVMLRHFTEGYPATTTVGHWVGAALDAGWIGVDLFFVLSGFLITGILLDAKASAHYFRNFYMRRTLRIFPLYYGVLIAVFCLAPLFGWLEVVDDSANRSPIWLFTYFTNIAMAWTGQVFFRHDWVNLQHFWSLSVEEHFYLFWPAIVYVSSRKRMLLIAATFVVVSPLLRLVMVLSSHELAAYVLTPCRLDALAVGSILAGLARNPNGLQPLIWPARTLVACASASLATIFVMRNGFVFYDHVMITAGYSLLAVLFGSLMTLALSGPEEKWIARTFSAPLLRFLGKYSYGTYVFHFLVIAWLNQIFPVTPLAAWFGSYAAGLTAHVLLCISMSIAMALASWHLYEKQFLKLKRFFSYDVRSPALEIPPRL